MKVTVLQSARSRTGIGRENLPNVVHEAAAIAVGYHRLSCDDPPQLVVSLMNPGVPGVQYFYDAVGTVISSGDTW